MAGKTASAAFCYYKNLALQNVKAFAGQQVLDLCATNGRPAPWTLILGDNGLGKTTLLRCLALMRPLPAKKQAAPPDAEPDIIEPAMWLESNDTLVNLARRGPRTEVSLSASLVYGSTFARRNPKEREFQTGLEFTTSRARIEAASRKEDVEIGTFQEPLVLGYGAGRHMGVANTENTDTDPVSSLFSTSAELFDAEELLTRVDYASLREARDKLKDKPATRQRDKLLKVIAALLPEIERPRNIHIYGPRLPGVGPGPSGVHIETPYGEVPFSELSLGYQTMTAWTVDIAWRLFAHYPNSPDPLSEPAIVIVDEIDLHLHPKWQRTVKRDLTLSFPNVQFIATAHSPLMAQTSLDANLVVLRRTGDSVEIVNEPEVIADWRLDQIVTSELFGLRSARPPEVERVLAERTDLLRKPKLSKADKARLVALDAEVEGMATAERGEDQEAMDLIREAARLLREREGAA